MYQIELQKSTAMSLLVNSTSGSEDEIEEIEEENEELEEIDDALSMSDEEFEKMSPDDFAEASEEEDGENNPLGDDDDNEPNEESNEEDEPDSADDGGSEQEDTDGEDVENQPSEEEVRQNTQVYEAAYRQLFEQPIKASGREVHLKGVDHAQSLIEMGLDYNKKMQYMRPHMQALKTLEKEGLLTDSEELNLLLEAKQGKPEAIRKLISKHGIDYVDLADNEEGAQDYIPQNHMVSTEEVEIEQALQSISRSPAYQETIDVMSNTFDSKSKEIISQNPQYIQSLNADIESGVYGRVMDMVQYQRDVRAIPTTVSDIEAYISTVQQMAAQEQTQAPVLQQQQQPAQSQNQPTRRSTGASRKQKAAMSGSRNASKKKEPEYNPMEVMSMSDDDFEKKFGNKFI